MSNVCKESSLIKKYICFSRNLSKVIESATINKIKGIIKIVNIKIGFNEIFTNIKRRCSVSYNLKIIGNYKIKITDLLTYSLIKVIIV
jgi:hypothetical protein